MKTQKSKNQNKIKFHLYEPIYNFSWVFSSKGLVGQSHDENEYRRYLDLNYISKSNKD